MKKRIWLITLTVILAVLALTFTACAPTQTEQKDYSEIFAMAQDAGYTGTLEELIEAFKGDSAYEIAVANGYEGTVTQWLASLAGAKGETPTIGDNGNWFIGGEDSGVKATGEKGATGVGISGIAKTASDGGTDTYTVTYTDSTTSTFTVTNGVSPTVSISEDGYWCIGGVKGEVKALGEDGTDGRGIASIAKTSSENNIDTYTITYTDATTSTFTVTNGEDGEYAGAGLSAYEIAVRQGFEGTEEQWIASLNGTNGQSAYEVAVANGYEGSVQDWVIALYSSFSDTAESTAIAGSKAVLSVVSVYATVQYTSYSGTWPPTPTTSTSVKAGAGVIYKDDKAAGDAYIITNFHVVYAEDTLASSVSVYLYGYEFAQNAIPATIVGGSMTNDIAVLKITGSELYKNSASRAAEIGDSASLVLGQTAIAVGNPESKGLALTAGVISKNFENITLTLADEKTTGSFRVVRYDTSVNSGNSGGGLFDGKGRLIGIVNAKDKTAYDFNYALPINVSASIADSIIRNCNGEDVLVTSVCTLGVTTQSQSSYSEVDPLSGLTYVKHKVEISDVTADSIADGKFQVGDVLISFTYGGKTVVVDNPYTLHDYRFDWVKDETITFTVDRNGETVSFDLVLSVVTEVK